MTARYFIVATLMRQAQGGYANLVLDTQLKKHPLAPRDKAFATAVFYSVLEHQKTLDFILNQFLKKPVEKLDAPVREILRSGLAQARYMQVPPSAAVNESVKLAKSFQKTSAGGMVNAVLRRAIAYDLETATFKSDLERLCVLGSVSEAVAAFFLRTYPEDALLMLSQTAEEATTAIRVNPLLTESDALAARLREEGAREVLTADLPHCLRVAFEASPAHTQAFADGLFHVEGQTSQIAALSLGAQPGDTVIDFCAAPGGKSLAIAQEMQNRGVLYSCDVSPNRVSLIEKALQRGHITCAHAVQNDAAEQNPIERAQENAPSGEALADRILADVPCSGLGILAKKPDIRYKDLASLPELCALQAKILDNAAACLKQGGTLVYSTCTVNPAENEAQIEAFLQRHPDFVVRCDTMQHLPQTMTITPYGALSLAHKTGLDGFFICKMEKIECKNNVSLPCH